MIAEKEFPLQLHCDNCNEDGFVRYKGDNFFVICSRCKAETAQVWCPDCGMGGQFFRNVEKHPSSWKCPTCKRRHSLQPDFYDTHELLYFKENYPADLKNAIKTLRLPTPIEIAKRETLIWFVASLILYSITFLRQEDKSIKTFLVNADSILLLWTAFSSSMLIPSYISQIGREVTGKKGWHSQEVPYYLYIVPVVGVFIFKFSALFPVRSTHPNGNFFELFYFTSIILVFSLANGIYALLTGIFPSWMRGVYFYEHKHIKIIASIQILLSVLGLLWVYIRLS